MGWSLTEGGRGVEERVLRNAGFAPLESKENTDESSFGFGRHLTSARASEEVPSPNSMEPVTEPSNKRKLKTQIANLLESEVMSDVVFLVDQPPKRCPCHKLILGLGSQVFKTMFYGKIREKVEINVPDVTKEGFSIMLRGIPKVMQSSNLKLKLSGTTTHEGQELLCPSQYTGLFGAEVHEQISRFGGLSEERPSVFKTPSKLVTHLSTQCSKDERQSRPCPSTQTCGVEARYTTTRPYSMKNKT
ncbi:hypothetical protein TNCV_4391731 [Trichonephila clavipes]|nr:hypothetical protein TNCV_4391731 [Trichonephila clavipes]